MATGQWGVVLHQVQQLFQGRSLAGLSEGQLLDRFVADRDETAFEAIIARHGPMVLGVCRGVLRDPHDVDDAFQATFLILVKKARNLRDRDLLGPWLYGVARRVSLRSRGEILRKHARERTDVDPVAASSPTLEVELRELQQLIREEVDQLSDKARMAVVLCYLEGLTHEEAADRLGWPVGTVKGRLSRARATLRDRLSRRGVALPTASIASTLAQGASSSVRVDLVRSTILGAVHLASGQTLKAGIVSASAISLMEGVIGTMFTTPLKIAALALTATCCTVIPSVLAYQGVGEPKPRLENPAAPSSEAVTKTSLVKTEGSGLPGIKIDPSAEIEAARKGLDFLLKNPSAEFASLPTYTWSRRLAEAESTPETLAGQRLQALRDHFDRMETLRKKAKEDSQKLPQKNPLELAEVDYRVAEAKRWLSQGYVGAPGQGPRNSGWGANASTGRINVADPSGLVRQEGPLGPGPGAGTLRLDGSALKHLTTLTQSPEDEKRNDAIKKKLEEKISMNFPTETPLEDLRKYVETATQDEALGLPEGLPIYIDPEGLKTAEVTMASTFLVKLQGIPLRTTLRLILRQRGLDYRIDGGVLIVSDQDTIVLQEIKAKRAGAVAP